MGLAQTEKQANRITLPMSTLYLQERFLEFPLFQGMSRADLNEALAQLKLMRIPCLKGRVILQEGSRCDHLYFILSGKVNLSTEADDHSYVLTEEMSAPDIIQPEHIFGLNQRFTSTVSAATNCELIGIEKLDVMRLSDKYEIFRLNLLNIICTRAQRRSRFLWRVKPQSIRQKIARFIESRSLRPAGSKTLAITMTRLAAELGESRLNVSNELRVMEAASLIRLRRAEIQIPAFELLLK